MGDQGHQKTCYFSYDTIMRNQQFLPRLIINLLYMTPIVLNCSSSTVLLKEIPGMHYASISIIFKPVGYAPDQ